MVGLLLLDLDTFHVVWPMSGRGGATAILRRPGGAAHREPIPIWARRAPYVAQLIVLARPFPCLLGERYWRLMEPRPFVGRTEEFERLERALRRVQSGVGSTVLMTGDAGIGKSRLTSKLMTSARAAGFHVLVGRCIDLIGTELSYQPFAEALRPWSTRHGDGALPWLSQVRPADSQLRVFEETLALFSGLAAAAPVLLVLEDLHWADTSTLDLVVFLAHNVAERRLLLLATYRADELASAERLRRLADGVRRSGSALELELGPLEREDLTALLTARSGAPQPQPVADAIVARSEGNPFFAEELIAVAGTPGGELPRSLRDLLLQRVARLDRATQSLLKLAAAAGREADYVLLRDAASLPEASVRECLRRAVDHGVLVPDQATGRFRFRHALLAEAIYETLLPGEREELHAQLAAELAGGRTPASAAELAPHWEAAGRTADALAASVEAAREADSVFGPAEALAHLERALRAWAAVPDAHAIARLDLVELLSWAAQRALQTDSAPRAVELGLRAVALVGDDDPVRAALLNERLGNYLFAAGSRDAGLAARERAVELVPAQPASAARAHVLAALGHALMLVWRHEASRPICEQALALGRAVGAHPAEVRAQAVLGVDLAYLGHGEEGLEHLQLALHLAEQRRDPGELVFVYCWLTDVLTMLGRPRESIRLAAAAINVVRAYGVAHGTIVSNQIEALIATGEWDEADRLGAAALQPSTANWPHFRRLNRAALAIGRGEFDDARAHLEAANATVRGDGRASPMYDLLVTELALWERRWTDVETVVRDGLARTRERDAALIRVQLCAHGLRAQAELAALGRARRDAGAVRDRLARARKLVIAARRAATEAEPVTPNAAGWRAQAEAEHARARDQAQPDAWSEAATKWEQLERSPLATYCRWRQAEALVARGAGPAEASVPLRQAHAVAVGMRAQPLQRELTLLATRARLDPAYPEPEPLQVRHPMEDLLGLTPREAEVLTLVARGHTNREIAEALVISVKTTGHHVSHILHKLDVPTRADAAAIAHRIDAAG
jgi:DNA-binding CsgD family transcriptional regulator